MLLAGLASNAAFAADYYARTAGAGTVTTNWNQNTTWTTDSDCNGNALAVGVFPGVADNVFICSGKTVNITANAQALSVTFLANMPAGGTNSSLIHGAGISLAVGAGGVTINGSTAANGTRLWNIGTGSASVTGGVTLNGGSTNARIARINLSTGPSPAATLTIGGALTYTSANAARAVIDMTGGGANGQINLAGAFTVNTTGTLSMGTGAAIFNYNGTAAQQTVRTGSAIIYRHLHLNNTFNSGVPTTSGAVLSAAISATNVTGDVRVQTGSLSNGGFAMVGGAGDTFEVANGARFNLAGTTSVMPTGFATTTLGTTLPNPSTVAFHGTGNQVVATGTLTYGHLIAAGTGEKRPAAGTLAVAGNLTVETGSTFNANTSDPVINVTGDLHISGVYQSSNNAARTLSVTGNVTVGGTYTGNGAPLTMAGNFTRTGTFTSGTGVVTFNGPSMVTPQTLTGATTITNMTVNNTGLGLSLANDFTILNTGALVLTNGVVTTGANNLIVTRACNVAAAVTRTNGFVAGNLRKAIPANASTCTYEIGSGTSYTPAVLTFVNTTGAGNITASTTGVIHPQNAHVSSGIDSAKNLNRYWTITNNSVTIPAAGYGATFNFINGTPVDIASGTAANFIVERWTGAAWVAPTMNPGCTPTPAGNLCTRVSGLTAAAGFGDFWAGEVKVVAPPPPDSFNAVQVAANEVTGRIFTKLASIGFTLDIVAIQGGSQQATFNEAVTIDVVTGASGGSNCGGGSPNAIFNSISSSQNVTLSGGRFTMVTPFNVATAAPNARVRIRYPAGIGPYTITSCSSDNFTIRPQSFSGIQAPSLNNGGTTLPPHAKAGATFSIEATAGAGYTGIPTITLTSITPHAGVGVVTGTLAGSFGAGASGTGIASGSFTYSEVGSFTINSLAVIDDTFTDVSTDKTNNDCVTGSFSNMADGSGKYGCGFRNTAASSTIGRFTPDHFIVTPGTVTNRRALGCGSTFTYEGEELRVGFLVTARNGLTTPTTTQNYTTASGFAQLVGTVPANFGIGAVDLADATPPTTATALTPRLTLHASSGTWTAGAMTATVDLSVNRGAAPDGPFESFRIGALPVDADGITVRAAVLPPDLNLDTTVPADTPDRVLVGSSVIRFGRLAIGNASGSPLLPLPVRVEAQYWNASSFVTHASDSCTPIAASTDTGSNVAMSNYTGGLVMALASPNCKTEISGGGIGAKLNKGRLTLQLAAPKTAGAVDLTFNLGSGALGATTCLTSGALPGADTAANRAYLQSGTGFTQNPSARATFGAQSGAEEQIHRQEVY